VNSRGTQTVVGNELVKRKWRDIKVGDMVRLENNEFVTVRDAVCQAFVPFRCAQADIILISTSEPNGLCYIETAELDGETNLKVRQGLEETGDIKDDINKLSQFDGKNQDARADCHSILSIGFSAEIEYEPPNNNLGRFEGNLNWKGKTYPLKNDNMLLRGTRLRNTQWAYGSESCP
jgi:phospholipid-translocating ATPase